MTERKLVTVRLISALDPIEGADLIEVATVGGWKIVVKKGDFKVGQRAVYFEIDSWIPTEIAPFLTKPDKDPGVYNEIRGERLRTIRLRKQLSQGLLLPISNFDHLQLGNCDLEDFDLTELLKIQKWERALPQALQGTARGNFPQFIRKTDEERIQNLDRTLDKYKGEEFEESIKLDGSSCTMYILPENNKYLREDELTRFGVCSRNLDLKETEGNSFWSVARELDVETKLRSVSPRALAIQGELIGPNIQSNYEKVLKNDFFVFKIFDIDAQEYLLPDERRELCASLGLKHVPILSTNTILSEKFLTIADILTYADGPGMNKDVKREGIVFKHRKSQFSFKAISNSYLIATGN